MWYPKIDTVENVLKECATKFHIDVKDVLNSVVFIKDRREIKDYQPFVLHEAPSEWYLRNNEPTLFIFIDKNTFFYNRLNTVEKRRFTIIKNRLAKYVKDGCGNADLERMTILTFEGLKNENYASGYFNSSREALDSLYESVRIIHDDVLHELVERWIK